MSDDSRDPTDHARTTRQHAGETMKNGANAPGRIIMAVHHPHAEAPPPAS